MYRRAFFSLVRPQGFALVFLAVAVLVFLLGVLGTVAAWLDTDGGPEVAGSVWTLCTLPAVSLFLVAAAWGAKQAGPRLALGLLALLMTLVTAGFLVVFMSLTPVPTSPQPTLPMLFFASLVLCSPFLLGSAIPVFLALPHLPKEMEQALFAERVRLALDYIQRKGGFVSYQELADFLKTSESMVESVLAHLVTLKVIPGKPEPQYRLFVSEQALEKKYNDLLGMVEAQGQISFDALAAQLQAPPGLVREWVIALAGAGRFPGYIHWEQGILYSREAAVLGKVQRCPRCGGELTLAGKGVIRCEHCGTDVFLPRTRRKTRKKTAPAS